MIEDIEVGKSSYLGTLDIAPVTPLPANIGTQRDRREGTSQESEIAKLDGLAPEAAGLVRRYRRVLTGRL